MLFAIDKRTEEICVSDSPKGSLKITELARIPRQDNEALFAAVQRLTELAKDPNFSPTDFKTQDKLCQKLYKEHQNR